MTIVYRFKVSTIVIVAFIGLSSADFTTSYQNDSKSTCGPLEFRCKNGQCIPSDKLCDGQAQCTDKSDEVRTECMKPEILCGDFAFRCNYGACIDGDATCNGINDCVDKSDEELPKCRIFTSSNNSTCTIDEFRCSNGQCISDDLLCDGDVNCVDGSDETEALCKTRHCGPFVFRCAYGACIEKSLQCNGVRNCRDGSDEDPNTCRNILMNTPIPEIPSITPAPIYINVPHRPPTTPSYNEFRQNCRRALQPANGRWQLHRSQCPGDSNCDARSRFDFLPGTWLVYGCDEGYQISGFSNVFCGPDGNWSNKPVCNEIRCEPLSSASRDARCKLNNERISCELPVPPGTMAKLECQNSYRKDASVLSNQRENVRCNSQGQWEPKPIVCIAGPQIVNIYFNGVIVSLHDGGFINCNITHITEAINNGNIIYSDKRDSVANPKIDVRIECGLIRVEQKKLIVNGTRAKLPDFPWHATLYTAKNAQDANKQFICGATIIQSNLLITAAHCVYDEEYHRVQDPRTLFVATGNSFRDFDHSFNVFAKKANVTNVYVNCNFLGLEGNYAADIAILRIDKHFTFSSLLMPVCIDDSPASDLAVLEIGQVGKIAGFGRTGPNPSQASSQILQTLNVPYVSQQECQSTSALSNSGKFITLDKFCAGLTNGSSVCDGDSGGGLVFQTGRLYYLRGIVSTGLGLTRFGGERICDSSTYALYTRVSSHLEWIQDVLLKLEVYGSYPACLSRENRFRR